MINRKTAKRCGSFKQIVLFTFFFFAKSKVTYRLSNRKNFGPENVASDVKAAPSMV